MGLFLGGYLSSRKKSSEDKDLMVTVSIEAGLTRSQQPKPIIHVFKVTL